jgi:DNA-binding NarL/FixJ family response regulator
VAIQVAARPLRERIEGLARRARIDLETEEPAAPSAPRSTTDPYGLTVREREVLDLVAAGRTNREIGERLFISEKTASVHVTHILGKLGVSSRVEAALVAARAGMVDG